MLTLRDVLTYTKLLLRWWLVLAIAVLLSSGTAWWLLRRQPDFYVAQATLSVGNNFNINSPSNLSVELSNTLAGYYEVLMRREVILAPVAERLNLGFPWSYVSSFMLSTSINRQANLLEIRIVDSNPERAAALANGIAEQLISYSPNSPEKIAAQQGEVDRQLGETQTLIDAIDEKIDNLKAKQAGTDSAIDIRDLTDQLERLQESRDDYQATYNELLLLRESSVANSLALFEAASVPGEPLPKKQPLILGLAGLGGLLLAVLAVLVLDLLDQRWRSGGDLQQRLGIVHLGVISPGAPVALAGGEPGASQRMRAVGETYTQLVLQSQSGVPRTLLVSSPEPSEERSAYSIDLADSYAQSGHRVLIVDAGLAKPFATRLLLPEDAHAATGSTGREAAMQLWSGKHSRSYEVPSELWYHLRPTPVMNVALLPSKHSGPGEAPVLVPSLHWPELVHSLGDVADVIIFDGPSILTGADAALLAPLVDGVVLVLNPAIDTRAKIAESKARLLKHQSTRLLGAVTLAPTTSWQRKKNHVRRELAPPRRGNGRGLRIAVDASGITISMPRKQLAEESSAARPSTSLVQEGDAPGALELNRTVGEPLQPSAVAPQGAGGPHGHSLDERVPTWEELASGRPGQPHNERQTAPTITPTAPKVIITPPVIVTPPPEINGSGGGSARPRRRSPVGARETTRRGRRRQALEKSDELTEQ